jgi:hypothetical protein
MAHSLSEEENIGRREFSTGSIDEEIAALLSAIEEEKVPAQLQELALKLQAALANKRACQTAN